jgi:hypothetical protein
MKEGILEGTTPMTIDDFCLMKGCTKRSLAKASSISEAHLRDVIAGRRYPDGPGRKTIALLHLATGGLVSFEDMVDLEQYRHLVDTSLLSGRKAKQVA